MGDDSNDVITIKQRTAKLFSNLKYAITTPSAWTVVVCSFSVNGSLTNTGIKGIWWGPFLKEVFQFSYLNASNTLMGFAVGILIGSLIIPISVGKLFRTKKTATLTANLFAASVCISFIVCPINFHVQLSSFYICFLPLLPWEIVVSFISIWCHMFLCKHESNSNWIVKLYRKLIFNN